jgi:TPP-dependent pyruvate/acetoin dehydrogenase alpha subunit
VRKTLLAMQTVSQESLNKIEQEITRELDDAAQFAKSSPEPSPATLTEHLF